MKRFELALLLSLGSAAGLAQRGSVEEIQFLLPPGAELLLADVLLYEPAGPAKPSTDR